MATAKNITNLSCRAMCGRIPAAAQATTKVLPEATVFALLDDFDADDSSAMQHVIADDPRVFPWFGESVAPVARSRAP